LKAAKLHLRLKELSEEIVDRTHANYLDPAWSPFWDSPLRHVGRRHTHLRRLAEAPLRLRHRPDLAAQSYLAEENGRVCDGPIIDARG
jgi:hypothetical protein